MNRELPDVQAGFKKGRGTRDQIANICWIIEKAREFQKKNTPRHILIKLMNIKHKEQILEVARGKNTQEDSHRITADLSIETLQARRERQDTLKVMKEKNLQPRLLYPARISFKYEGEIKSFTDKQKLREPQNPLLNKC